MEESRFLKAVKKAKRERTTQEILEKSMKLEQAIKSKAWSKDENEVFIHLKLGWKVEMKDVERKWDYYHMIIFPEST